MMPQLFSVFYQMGVAAYVGALHLAAPFHSKAAAWVQGRYRLLTEMSQRLQPGEKRIWLHCASAGEFEQGRPVLELLRHRFPDHKFVLTFFSPSGYQLHSKNPLADYVFYLPADFPRSIRRFLALLQPRLAVFVKYELWFELLNQLQQQAVPTALIAARFHARHRLFHPLLAPLRNTLRHAQIFVQDQKSFELLRQQGFEDLILAGDPRFDRVWAIANQPQSLPIIEAFADKHHVLVAGSTWPKDEYLLQKAFRQLDAKWKWILVPHEVSEDRIGALHRKLPHAVRYSQATEADACRARILIVDRLGLLARIYHYATVAYVGGGFDRGIHNTLEAAVYGIAVVFGPRYRPFIEACDLVKRGTARAIRNAEQLVEAINWFARTENRNAAQQNRTWVYEHTGASRSITEALAARIK